MINELEVLRRIVKKLEYAGIPYMITGSVAANFYTTPRMTRDIDIVIEVVENDVDMLFSLFSKDFYIDKDSVRNAICEKKMFNIIHNEGIVKVDFIVKKDIEYRKIEFGRKQCIDFEGLRINITSPEDLVLSKLFWARESISEIQIRDVKNILRAVPNLDIDYLEKWVKELKLERVYKEVKDE